MTLPPLDGRGLLPSGVHDATWEEIGDTFCHNNHRVELYGDLQRFIEADLAPLPSPTPLFLGGSFFSDKLWPEDIEMTAPLELDTLAAPWGLKLLSLGSAATHERVYNTYRVDFYVSAESLGFHSFIEFFQYVGPKTAAAKGLARTDRRGIVRVMA